MTEKDAKILAAADYAIAHYEQGKTYSSMDVHKMLCDAFLAGIDWKGEE